MSSKTADEMLVRMRESEESKGAHYFDVLQGDDKTLYVASYAGMGETLAHALPPHEVALIQQLLDRGAVVVDTTRRKIFPLMEFVHREGQRVETHNGNWASGFRVRVVR